MKKLGIKFGWWDVAFCVVLLVLLVAYLFEARRNQFAPHLVTVEVNGRVYDTYWVTNPVVVRQRAIPIITSDGKMSYEIEFETNYLWKQWSIFK
ncbi:MAG: hypothetical protein WDM80_09450 [Limisphaerales bacterium]